MAGPELKAEHSVTSPSLVISKTENPISKSDNPKTLERFDIVSKFCIGIVGLVLSGVIGLSTIYFSRQATERQANAQIEALALQRRSSAGQLELSLLPVFARGTDAERELALSILASVAPDEAERLGTIVIPQLKSELQRRQASQVISSVPERKREQEFRQRIQNAGVYRQFSLDANACREYFAAFETLLAPERKGIIKEIETARMEYSQGRFNDAASRLQAALGPK